MPAQKAVLITGANKGLGFEAAKQLTAKGFHVFLAARNRDLGTKAAAQLQKWGAKVTFIQLDVTDPASIAKAVKEVATQVDHLDALVNNAGVIVDGDDNVLTLSADAVLQTFTINSLGSLQVAQAFSPLLVKSKAARIVNVSSGAGQLSDMGTFAPAYAISKAALNAVTCQLAAALKDKGIAVNSVCPGWCRTDMGGANATRSAEEGADTIAWLASDAPQNLTAKFFRDRKEIAW